MMMKNEVKTKILLQKLQAQKKREEVNNKKNITEFERINEKEIAYENDVELDQLLCNYKIAFANLCGFVCKEYFPGLAITLEKLITKVFKRPGKIITKGRNTEIVIYLSEKDKLMADLIEQACNIINKKIIKLYNKTTLKLTPLMQELK